MSRLEILNVDNFRFDGRRPFEFRSIDYKLEDNNVYFNQGLTKLKVNISGYNNFNKQELNIFVNNINSNLSKSKVDSLIQQLKSTFLSVIKFQLKSSININIDILNLDGSLLSTAINALSLALSLNGIELLDIVTSTNIGVFNNNLLIDLNNFEEIDCPSITLASLSNFDTLSLVNLDSKLHSSFLTDIISLSTSTNQLLRDNLCSILLSNAI